VGGLPPSRQQAALAGSPSKPPLDSRIRFVLCRAREMTAGSGSGPSLRQHERPDVRIGESRDNLLLLERWSVRVPARFPADG